MLLGIHGKNLLIGGGIVFPTAKHAGIVLEGGYNIQTMKHVGGGTTMSGNVITIGLGVIGMIF